MENQKNIEWHYLGSERKNNLYPVKISSKKDEIKILLDQQKLREFITYRFTLQETLKKVLQAEGQWPQGEARNAQRYEEHWKG